MMKSCPQCNQELSAKTPAVCPGCGFALTTTDTPTLRNHDTAKIDRGDSAEPVDLTISMDPTIINEPAPNSNSATHSNPTLQQSGQNDELDYATAQTIRQPNAPSSPSTHGDDDTSFQITGGATPNDQTLMAGPMETMSRPLDDNLQPATITHQSTTKPPTTLPPNSTQPRQKTVVGRRLPTIVNPQAALDAAEAYSEGLQSLIPPRTIVRKEEAAEHSDYQIINRIGSGAYGVVYQAKQVPLERSVAVKMLQNFTDNEEHQQRIKNEFLREAQFTGRLEHPNIVPIHDIGLTVSPQGKVNPFYVMKEIRGESWQSVIKDKSPKDNLEIFKNTINAIAFAHSQNILHCDLKPDNVMLGEFGEVLVVDWGQAVDLSVPQTMRPGGTPAYISPEMAQYWIDIYLNHKKESKSRDEVGVRSDVYLLGSLLFETITGTPPHCKTPGEPPYEVIAKAAKNQIVDYEDNVDKDLLNIALRALRATDGNHIETTEGLLVAIDQYENRSLSIQLRRRADQLLETAVAEADYDAFQRSRFSYEEAIEKWDGNEDARKGLRDAKLRCAEHALADQNFDLGLDVLDNADGDPETVLREQLTEGKKIRDRRKRWIAGLAIGLAGSILLGILANGYMINENLKSVKARNVAVKEKEKVETEKIALESEKQAIVNKKQQLEKSIEPMRQEQAQMQKTIADFPVKLKVLDKQFKQETAKKEAEFEAQKQKLREQEEQLKQEQALKQNKLQSEIDNLGEQKETLAVEKQSLEGQVVELNESSKMLRYKSGLTQVSADLQSGDYFNARKTLDQYQNQNDWEVARLNLLAHREIKSLYPAEPINSIAATADGQQLAIAFPDRIEIRQLNALDQPGKRIMKTDVSAIAISPDGNQIYAAKPSDSPLTAGQIAVFDASRTEPTKPTRVLDAQSVSIDQIEVNQTGTALLSVGKPSALRQSSGQGLEEPLMVWIDGKKVNVNLVLPNGSKRGSKPKFDSASFSNDGQRILLTNRSGLPRDQAAYVFERNETGYRWIATSPITGISAATFVTNNDVVAGIQNANTGSYSLVNWRYNNPESKNATNGQPSSGSLTIVSPLNSKAIQLRQQGNFVIAIENDRQATIWDWRNKQSIKLKGQSRPAKTCFIKSGKRLEDCQVITAAIGKKPELLSIDLSMYQPEHQRQSIGWSPENRPASVTAVFSPAATNGSLQAFGNDYGMASVIRDKKRVQWNISAWQYQVTTDDFVFAQSAEDYLYRYDRASGAVDRVLTKLARFLNGRERITDFQASDDGQVALVQTDSNQPKFLLWNLQQDRLIREINYGQQNLFGTGSQKRLPKLSLSRDGKWVIGAKVGVFGWPVDSGQLIRFTNNNASSARSIANSIVFVRNSQQMLVSWQNRVVQFDLNSQQQIQSHTLPKIADAQVQNNLLDAIDSNGKIYILAAENMSAGGILLLSLKSQTQLTRFANASFASFAKTKTGISAIAGGLDQKRKIRLYRWNEADPASQKINLPVLDDAEMTTHFTGFERVYESPRHGILLQTSRRNRGSTRRVWSSLAITTDKAAAPKKATALGPLQVLSRPSIKQIIAQTKQAATLANNQILFWKLSNTGVKPDGTLDTRAITMQLAPDSNTLAISTTDNRCLLYDFSKRKKLAQFDLKNNEGQVTAIAWQADSKAIAFGRSAGSIEVFELNQDNPAESAGSTLTLQTPIEAAIRGLHYSQDGSLLATVPDNGIAVLIRAAGKQATKIQSTDAVLNETVYGHADGQKISAAHISADSKRIISGSNTGRITIWNSQATQQQTTNEVQQASSERELLNLPDLHQSPISIVRFVNSPTGKMIFSAEQNSGKNEIIAWPAAKNFFDTR